MDTPICWRSLSEQERATCIGELRDFQCCSKHVWNVKGELQADWNSRILPLINTLVSQNYKQVFGKRGVQALVAFHLYWLSNADDPSTAQPTIFILTADKKAASKARKLIAKHEIFKSLNTGFDILFEGKSILWRAGTSMEHRHVHSTGTTTSLCGAPVVLYRWPITPGANGRNATIFCTIYIETHLFAIVPAHVLVPDNSHGVSQENYDETELASSASDLDSSDKSDGTNSDDSGYQEGESSSTESQILNSTPDENHMLAKHSLCLRTSEQSLDSMARSFVSLGHWDSEKMPELRSSVRLASSKLDYALIRLSDPISTVSNTVLTPNNSLIDVKTFSEHIPSDKVLLVLGGSGVQEVSISSTSASILLPRTQQPLGVWELNHVLAPGDSGSPVLNMDGEILGMAVATVPDYSITYMIPASHIFHHICSSTKAWADGTIGILTDARSEMSSSLSLPVAPTHELHDTRKRATSSIDTPLHNQPHLLDSQAAPSQAPKHQSNLDNPTENMVVALKAASLTSNDIELPLLQIESDLRVDHPAAELRHGLEAQLVRADDHDNCFVSNEAIDTIWSENEDVLKSKLGLHDWSDAELFDIIKQELRKIACILCWIRYEPYSEVLQQFCRKLRWSSRFRYSLAWRDANLPMSPITCERYLGHEAGQLFYQAQFIFTPVLVSSKKNTIERIENIHSMQRWPYAEMPKPIEYGPYGLAAKASIVEGSLTDGVSSNRKEEVVAFKTVRVPFDWSIAGHHVTFLKEGVLQHERLSLHLATFVQSRNLHIVLPHTELGDLEVFFRGDIWHDDDSVTQKSYDLNPFFQDFNIFDVVREFGMIVDATAYLHSYAFCTHVCLRPQNILIFPGGKDNPVGIWRISDFGISSTHHCRSGKLDIDLTMHSSVRDLFESVQSSAGYSHGGPYTAPEKLFGYIQDPDRTDIWSLGCILAEILVFSTGTNQPGSRWTSLLNFRSRRQNTRAQGVVDCFFDVEESMQSHKSYCEISVERRVPVNNLLEEINRSEPGILKDLAVVVHRMIQPDPAERYTASQAYNRILLACDTHTDHMKSVLRISYQQKAIDIPKKWRILAKKNVSDKVDVSDWVFVRELNNPLEISSALLASTIQRHQIPQVKNELRPQFIRSIPRPLISTRPSIYPTLSARRSEEESRPRVTSSSELPPVGAQNAARTERESILRAQEQELKQRLEQLETEDTQRAEQMEELQRQTVAAQKTLVKQQVRARATADLASQHLLSSPPLPPANKGKGKAPQLPSTEDQIYGVD